MIGQIIIADGGPRPSHERYIPNVPTLLRQSQRIELSLDSDYPATLTLIVLLVRD